MFFQYMTSNVPFRNQADTNILNIRMRDAAAQGLKLPDWCTPEFYSYEHNKNQRINLKIDENNNATFAVRSFEKDDADIIDTDKLYFASLKWINTEEKAAVLIQYLREHLQATGEVELCFLYQGPEYKVDEIECEIVQIDTLLASEVKAFFEEDTLDMPRRMIVRK